MVKDRRYKAVKKLIETGEITAFGEIFDFVPKTVVTLDFGTNHSTFKKLKENPDLFTLRELKTLASFFEIDPKLMIDLAYNSSISDKKSARKK